MWYKVDKNDDKTYSIKMTDTFYKKMFPYFHNGSYWNVMYRLFGLAPQDFYHYCGFTYKAFFKKSDSIQHVSVYWNDEACAKKFCEELNTRFSICIKRGDFK